MADACLITRGSGDPIFDEDTGTYTQGSSTLYAGRCRVQASLMAAEQDAGDAFNIVNRVTISVPIGTLGLAKGDLVTITEAADNPQILNAQYRVRSIQDKSQATAVRLECEET